jgi:UrcA family protein
MRTTTGSRILVIGALLLALGSASAANRDQTASSIVRYDDLDLSAPAGMRTLKGRIKAAAGQVCATATTSDRFRSTVAHHRCRRDATTRVLEQIRM